MINQEVYATCKRLVDSDKGYEALECLSKMLEERNTELKNVAIHRSAVINTIKKFTRIDIPTTAKGLRSRLDVIGDFLEDEQSINYEVLSSDALLALRHCDIMEFDKTKGEPICPYYSKNCGIVISEGNCEWIRKEHQNV